MDIETIHSNYKASTSVLTTANGIDFEGWINEAQLWHRIVAGEQWKYEDFFALKSENRPAITFNRTGVMVDVVAGLEIQNRMEPMFFPRDVNTNPKASDYMSATHSWVRDNADFEEEESQAFADLLTAGMGWTLTTMDYATEMDGDIEKVCIDPLRCRWDPACHRKNLKGSRWRMYIMDITKEEVERRWPKADLEGKGGPWDSDIENLYSGGTYLADQAWKYDRTLKQTEHQRGVMRVAIYQYAEYKTVYRVEQEGQIYNLSASEFKQRKAQIEQLGLRYVKQQQKEIRQQHILGDTVLDDGPTLTGEFTLQAMTGKYDKSNRCFYGLVRAMKDPQLWANKFVSSILDIVATNAKGGIMAESGAFQNERKAKEEWARSDKIAMLEPGGIPKIQPKPLSPIPQGLQYLLEYTGTMFPQASGVSLEMMGLVQRDQPGVLEHQRKQAGLTMLAWAFSALRYYRKIDAKSVIEIARKFMSDGRMMRIQAEGGPEVTRLVKDELALKYDVVVDESPTSVSMKERTWAMLVEIVPSLLQAGIPIPPSIIKYSPLPEQLKGEWMQYIQQAQQPQQPSEQDQADVQKTQSEAQKNQAQAELNVAKAEEISNESPVKIIERMAASRLKQAKAGREAGLTES